MAKYIVNPSNSFVTFYNLVTDQGASNFITNTDCGIKKGFCLPVYDGEDVRFQIQIASDEVLTSSNVIPNIIINGTGGALTNVALHFEEFGTYNSLPLYNIYVNYTDSDLTALLSDGDCFQLSFTIGTDELLLLYAISNQCFQKIDDKCLTSQLRYINSSNAFDFKYYSWGTFPLIELNTNVVRLPIYFKEPRNPTDKGQYRNSQGRWVTTNARINKTYKGFLDLVTEEVHCALNIALNHDSVIFVTENEYSLSCNFQGEYNNNFPNIMQNVDVWSADFTIFETPYNNVNTNCG